MSLIHNFCCTHAKSYILMYLCVDIYAFLTFKWLRHPWNCGRHKYLRIFIYCLILCPLFLIINFFFLFLKFMAVEICRKRCRNVVPVRFKKKHCILLLHIFKLKSNLRKFFAPDGDRTCHFLYQYNILRKQ